MGARVVSNCMTPGAIYGTDIKSDKITLTVELPLPILHGLSPKEEQKLVKIMHTNVLCFMEDIYRDYWRRIAGQQINGNIMPKEWGELDTNSRHGFIR